MSLSGKHALITGGGTGIGKAAARHLADMGCKLTLLGRDEARLKAVAADIPGALAVSADVTDDAATARAFEAATAHHGLIAILVNNAGAATSSPFLKTSRADWDWMLAVNLTSAFVCSQLALPAMLAAGWGRIVNVASVAGLAGAPYIAPYVAAKHGMVGLTRALAAEVAKKNITVNAVCPGYVDSEMTDRTVANIMQKTGLSDADARAALAKDHAHGRLVTVDECASAIAWLCTEGAASANGVALPIAGGAV